MKEAVREDSTKNLGFDCKLIDSAALATANYPQEWLAEHVLITGLPAVIGGPQKSLKTSVGIELAISLATGKPFLGQFDVPVQKRVAVFSGESGPATIKETAKRICAAKGLRLKNCNVWWEFSLPALGNRAHLQALYSGLRQREIQVVILDPLYLCLLKGSKASAANLYEVGPILCDAARACLDAGATPILIHHVTKGANKKEFLSLEDLAFAGIGEFARQWILLNRREPYAMDGNHRLSMAIGSSAGHSSYRHLDVSEGTVGDDLTGRRWEVRCFDRPQSAKKPVRAKERDYAGLERMS